MSADHSDTDDTDPATDAETAGHELNRRTQARTRVHAARLAGLLAALGVLVCCVLLSVSVGAKSIPIGTVWDTLWSFNGSYGQSYAHGYNHSVIFELRLPRTVLGVAVGAALGLTGALLQALVRNPLADPGILGINAGATAAVVVAIFVFGLTGLNAYVWFGFAGAAASWALVYMLGSRGRASATPIRLALAGAAVGAALTGLTTTVVISNDFVFDEIRFWRVGSLIGRDLGVLLNVLPFLLVGAVLALALGPALNTIALGEDLAAALGARIGQTRLLSAIAVVLLCGGATAAAGPIGFVGLTVPHVARAITGPDQRWVLPYSAVLAAILLVGADILGRVVLPTGELEVGIITALVGAPVFIILVRRTRMAQL